jgi:hypothetical protein
MAAEVLIGTPTVDGTVYTQYTLSIIALLWSVRGRTDLSIRPPHFVKGSLVSQARNALASTVLERPSVTHLLFVDSDIGFEPKAVLQMLAYDKPVVACSYPRREVDRARLQAAHRAVDDLDLATRIAQNYVCYDDMIRTPHASGGFALEVKGGFVRTARVGMGLTLIRRDALEMMRARFPNLNRPVNDSYRALGVRNEIFQCFESEPDANGIYVGEDIAFCQRWIDGCGGEIWLNVDPVVTHTGPVEFSGRLIDRLQHTDRKAF